MKYEVLSWSHYNDIGVIIDSAKTSWNNMVSFHDTWWLYTLFVVSFMFPISFQK